MKTVKARRRPTQRTVRSQLKPQLKWLEVYLTSAWNGRIRQFPCMVNCPCYLTVPAVHQQFTSDLPSEHCALMRAMRRCGQTWGFNLCSRAFKALGNKNLEAP